MLILLKRQSIEMINKSSYRNPFLLYFIAAFLICLSYFICGFNYETNDDFAMEYCLRGKLGAMPVIHYFTWMHGLSYPLYFLYDLIPDFPFYSLFYYLSFSCIVFIFFKILADSVFSDSALKLLAVFAGLFALLFLESMMYLNFTRLAVFMSGSAVIFAFYTREGKKERYFLAFCLFAIGSLVRPDIIPYILIITIPSVFLFQYGHLKKNLLFAGTGFFVISAIIYFSVYFLSNEAFQKKILFADIIDYNIFDETSDKRKQIILEAILSWIHSDDQFMKIDDLRILSGSKSIFSAKFLLLKLNQNLSYTIELVIQNYFYLLGLQLLLLTGMIAEKSILLRERVFLIVYNIYFLVVLLSLSVFFKPVERIIFPSLALLCLVDLLFFLKYKRLDFLAASKAILCLLFLVFTLKIHNRITFNNKVRAENEKVLHLFNQALKDKRVFSGSLSVHFPFLDPFKSYTFTYGKNLTRLTGGLSFFEENYYQVKSNRSGSFFRLAFKPENIQDNTVLIGNQAEISILENYLNVLHGITLDLELIPDEELAAISHLRIFKVNKNTRN